VEQFRELAEAHGGGDFEWAASEEERNRLWQARHDALWAILAANPGKKAYATDVCVPISNLAEVIADIRAEVDKSPLDSAIIGHAGDGNFHMVFCISPEDEEVLNEVYRLNECLVSTALAKGGTCTGEHGIGTGKLKYMRREHGDAAIEMMQTIKRALDPHNILNPGKTIALPD
ncbi:MAG: FAD-binding oxidoreductase, partial [Gammaproteobacteria bacterium]|nr:FAD-binding oxidoreductase [Gammaproteobacteria bacterium]